ncbi:MAG TPA: ferritin-like domain-containing protein [Thermohalobaculum sp.]|nr:ferritin-like domain-containing protein [Thermohalobaculum sp.]
MSVKSLDDLFVHTLKDVLYAEKQILKALPKMEKKASSDALKTLFGEHRKETEEHVERLSKVFEQIGKKPGTEKCDAILGIIEEAEELMGEIEDGETLDAGMIAAAQAVEHYEIARYGTLCAWAKELGHTEAASILEKTLKEEKAADEKLSGIAESRLNKRAA